MSTLSTTRRVGVAAGALSLVLGGASVAFAADLGGAVTSTVGTVSTVTGTLPLPTPSPTATVPAVPLPAPLPNPLSTPQTITVPPLPGIGSGSAPAPAPLPGGSAPVGSESGTVSGSNGGSNDRSVAVTPRRPDAATQRVADDIGTAALSSLGFSGSSLFAASDFGASGPLLLPGIAEGDINFGEEPAIALPAVPGAEQLVIPSAVTSGTGALPGLAVLLALATLGGAATVHMRMLRSRVAIRFGAND